MEPKNESSNESEKMAKDTQLESNKVETTNSVSKSKLEFLDKPNNFSNYSLNTQNENFVCVDEHGLMYSFTIESNHIKDGGKILPQDGLVSNVTAMAIKKDLIMFGDSDGNLVKWDVKNRTSKSVSFRREVKKLKFAPGKENLLLLINLNDSLEIWDANNFDNFSSMKLNAIPNKVKLIDVDWCSSDRICCLFSDSNFKIFDVNFKQTSNQKSQIPSLIYFNSKLSDAKQFSFEEYFSFKNLFYEIIDTFDDFNHFDLNRIDDLIDIFASKQSNCLAQDLTQNTNRNLKDIILKIKEFKADSILFKKIYGYFLLSNYFSCSPFECTFWNLILYVLNNTTNLVHLVKKHAYFLERNQFRLNEYQFLKIYKEKQDPKQTKNNILIKNLLMCNEVDYVFNLFLDTEFQTENYQNDYLKACLIASLKNQTDNSNSQTSIKLVATNLIANGKLAEGLELLCLIDLVNDACRYLQDNNEWERAAWLAKIRLNESEYNEVIKRWCDHLCLTRRRHMAILLLVSCKQFQKAFEILSETRNYELTYYFMNLCVKYKLVQTCEDKVSNTSSHLNTDLINKITKNYELFKKECYSKH